MNPNFASWARTSRRPWASRSCAGRDIAETDGPRRRRSRWSTRASPATSSPARTPLGRRFGSAQDATADIEIVGVVKDGKAANLREETKRFVYVPYTQKEPLGAMTYYVRAGGRRRRPRRPRATPSCAAWTPRCP